MFTDVSIGSTVPAFNDVALRKFVTAVRVTNFATFWRK
jgi:hypothetical protein